MKPSRNPFKLLLGKVTDKTTHDNFQEVHRAMADMHPVVGGKETEKILLAAGQNKIKPPIAKPRGRVTIFQNAHATVLDEGLDDNGFWIVDASAPVIVKFLFY